MTTLTSSAPIAPRAWRKGPEAGGGALAALLQPRAPTPTAFSVRGADQSSPAP